MRTALVSLCWLGEPWRIERYQRWLRYNRAIKEQLGFDDIVLIDNASSLADLAQLDFDKDTHIIRYGNHLARGGVQEIPYCWRGMEAVKQLTLVYDKLLIIDSDCYILSQKLASYVKDLKSGYTALWCAKYGFPEAALTVLCKDAYPKVLNLSIPSYDFYNNKPMEEILPFTHINKNFIGDRYGETGEPQTKEMDFYCQWSAGCPNLEFNLCS